MVVCQLFVLVLPLARVRYYSITVILNCTIGMHVQYFVDIVHTFLV